MYALLRFTVLLTMLYFCSGVSATPVTFNLNTHVMTIPALIVIDDQTKITDMSLIPQSEVKVIIKDFELIESVPLFCRFSPVNQGCSEWVK